AKDIHNQTDKAKLYMKNRGLNTTNVAVIRQARMPAALPEIAFTTNKPDDKLLKNKQDELATAIAKGILKNLGIKYKAKSKPKKDNKGLYKVQVGAFKDKKNAEKLAKELKKKGYSNFIKKE